jgi:hypothetical protein
MYCENRERWILLKKIKQNQSPFVYVKKQKRTVRVKETGIVPGYVRLKMLLYLNHQVVYNKEHIALCCCDGCNITIAAMDAV